MKGYHLKAIISILFLYVILFLLKSPTTVLAVTCRNPALECNLSDGKCWCPSANQPFGWGYVGDYPETCDYTWTDVACSGSPQSEVNNQWTCNYPVCTSMSYSDGATCEWQLAGYCAAGDVCQSEPYLSAGKCNSNYEERQVQPCSVGGTYKTCCNGASISENSCSTSTNACVESTSVMCGPGIDAAFCATLQPWFKCAPNTDCGPDACLVAYPAPTSTPTATPIPTSEPTATPTPIPEGIAACDSACGTCGFRNSNGSCTTSNSCCHRTCSGNTCITVFGTGSNTCNSNPQCITPTPTSTSTPTPTPAPLPAPMPINSICTVPNATLSWSTVPNASSYLYQVKDTISSWLPYTQTSNTTATYPPSTLYPDTIAGHSYNWMVMACAGSRCSNWSTPSSFACPTPTPTPTTAPGWSPTPNITKPSCLTTPIAPNSSNQLKISWTNNATPVSWVDISEDNFISAFHKGSRATGNADGFISNPNQFVETPAPAGFGGYQNIRGPLTIYANQSYVRTYYVRTYNGSSINNGHSAVVSFNIPTCPTPTATPAPSSTPVPVSPGVTVTPSNTPTPAPPPLEWITSTPTPTGYYPAWLYIQGGDVHVNK